MCELIVLLARFEIHLGGQTALDNGSHSTSNEAHRLAVYSRLLLETTRTSESWFRMLRSRIFRGCLRWINVSRRVDASQSQYCYELQTLVYSNANHIVNIRFWIKILAHLSKKWFCFVECQTICDNYYLSNIKYDYWNALYYKKERNLNIFKFFIDLLHFIDRYIRVYHRAMYRYIEILRSFRIIWYLRCNSFNLFRQFI